MRKKFPQLLHFVINCFLIAVFVNSIVSVTQIVNDKEFTFFEVIQIFLFIVGVSALVFAVVCALLYLICLLAGMGQEKIFWLIMAVGIITTTVVCILFKKEFHKYTDQPNYLVAIAAFSIMVSLASQYQLFHNGDSLLQETSKSSLSKA